MRNPVRVPEGFAREERADRATNWAGQRCRREKVGLWRARRRAEGKTRVFGRRQGFFHHGGTEAVEGEERHGDPHGGFTEARLTLSFLSPFSAVYG